MKIKTILLLLILSLNMSAQEKQLFTLEELNYGGNRYHTIQPQNKWYAWWGDELIRTDVEECWLVDKRTGKETRLFTLDEVNKWLKSDDMYHVRALYYATFPYPDQPWVALGNKKSFLLLNFKTHEIVWQDSISGQKANDWNPVSKATAYIEDDQLFVVDGKGGKHQLTTDGSREIVYGQSVHRNEFGIDKGTFWSPDGMRLAFYRMDQSMVTDYPQVDIDPRSATHEPDKYPMAGMTSHQVTVGVYDLDTQKTTYLKAGDPTDRYFTNIAWSPDAKTIYMFELNRDQNDCRLVSYDAMTGEKKAELYRETSDKYVEPLHPIQFLPWDDDLFILQSQKDGYNHLYLYNKEGKLQRQLTKGNFVIQEVLGFNEKQKSVLVAANKYHPLHRWLYNVNIKDGKMTELVSADGVHHGKLSSSGTYLVDRWSNPTTPRNIDLVEVKTAKATRLMTAEDPWKDYEQPIFECGTIKAADGITDLYYRMVKPYNFDATKKYPTVVYVYGGPHAHNVEAAWHWYSRSWETYMAQKGYILFILDNRGSEYRGRDFEQATFRQLGQIEMQDQMKGVEYLRSLPYVDMDRLGVHGWSFGGFMTISLMTNYPDVFKVGVAGGPVIDWKWYEVMYGERYMDTPETNPEGYEKISLLSKAKNLKGKLQIITGYNDNTVVPQHCLSFLKACIEAGTQPDFFVYPGEAHNMRGHASVHLHERITQYFEDYLK
ncbi:S9 family peptidase [Prevotella sp. tf2-5]|uniref:S9 family peptidase n=1 Tax=Prevotella sp. tf2-5 TaxID=1761889 RepID=UPI000B815039|nr:S9 family peptidase [Prevotella sp. tf2-5]